MPMHSSMMYIIVVSMRCVYKFESIVNVDIVDTGKRILVMNCLFLR